MEHLDAVQALLDREAIRNVLYLYARAVDRRDRDLLESLYHPDANDDHGAYRGNVSGFVEYVVGNDAYEAMHHSITSIQIDLLGDVARVESYFNFTARRRGPDGPVLDYLVGRFLDRFERRDGAWKIADRVVVRDIRQNVPLVDPGDLFERSQPFPDDLVYRAVAL